MSTTKGENMCDGMISDERLFHGQTLDIKDADEKQWYIECMTLEIQKLGFQADIAQLETTKDIQIEIQKTKQLEAQVALQEAKNQATIIDNDKPKDHGHVVVNCARCGSELDYEGPGAADVHAKFQDEHYQCS
jgi:hypothetical protein